MAEFISNSAILRTTCFNAALTDVPGDLARARIMADFRRKSAMSFVRTSMHCRRSDLSNGSPLFCKNDSRANSLQIWVLVQRLKIPHRTRTQPEGPLTRTASPECDESSLCGPTSVFTGKH